MRASTVFLISGIGFFLLSFLGMGLAPWTSLKGLQPPPGYQVRTDLEEYGRQIFIREGCWHCHTQFVRPVVNEALYYEGPVSTAAEYLYEIPQLFGTRRVGPDLAREAGKKTDDWHYAHLYNPRSVVPWSVMPAYPWYFEEKDGKIVPKREAQALVAYLQSLGRDKLPVMRAMDSTYRATFSVGPRPPRTQDLLERGRELFLRECSGCHGPDGRARSLAARMLTPPPADLTVIHPTPEYVYEVTYLGIPGSAMPHFRRYTNEDVWAIAYYVESLYREPPLPPAAPEKTPELLARGQTLYGQMCSSCHGEQGFGDGPAAAPLKPAPANFRKLRPSVVHTFDVLTRGVPGTAMAAYAHLPEEDRWALAYYVEELSRGAESLTASLTPAGPEAPPSRPAPESPGQPEPSPKPEAASAGPEPTPELLARGKSVYAQVCLACHGAAGDGKGPAGAALNPPPADFTDTEWKHGGAPEAIFRVITDGVPGTAMAPFGHLPEEDRWALVYYVKSFSDPELRKLLK